MKWYNQIRMKQTLTYILVFLLVLMMILAVVDASFFSFLTVIPADILQKILYLLGITNIIAFLLIFFSCRCLAGIELIKKLMGYEWYRNFFNYHCWYWYILLISVALHTILAFVLIGNPF